MSTKQEKREEAFRFGEGVATRGEEVSNYRTKYSDPQLQKAFYTGYMEGLAKAKGFRTKRETKK